MPFGFCFGISVSPIGLWQNSTLANNPNGWLNSESVGLAHNRYVSCPFFSTDRRALFRIDTITEEEIRHEVMFESDVSSVHHRPLCGLCVSEKRLSPFPAYYS